MRQMRTMWSRRRSCVDIECWKASNPGRISAHGLRREHRACPVSQHRSRQTKGSVSAMLRWILKNGWRHEKGPPRKCEVALSGLIPRPKLLGRDEGLSGKAAVSVALGDLGDRDGAVVAGVSCLAELGHAQGNDLVHGVAGRLHIVARIELLRLRPSHPA